MSGQKSKIESAIGVLLLGGVGCFLLSFIAMGLAPWTSLKHVVAAAGNKSNPYIDDKGELTSVGRGRKTYIKEACWHCHSQFVRPVAGEPYRYGPASQAWESMFDIPQTFGTRRIGPDLSREAGRRSDDWHLAHLYNPRITTPLSVMPAYRWLFESTETGVIPKPEALDLVAYLQYLGEAYKDEIQKIVYPKIFKVTGFPEMDDVNLERGTTLFRENCIGCHGSKGDGLGIGGQFLKPQPPSLSDRFIAPSEAYATLNRGVLGSSMPSFREMPERDLWAIALFVSSLGEETKKRELEVTSDALAVSKGRALFQNNCVVCHGPSGAGDGVTAAAFNPRPKDFTRRVFSMERFSKILSQGVLGSAMPGFPQLSREDASNLHAFIKTLYKEER